MRFYLKRAQRSFRRPFLRLREQQIQKHAPYTTKTLQSFYASKSLIMGVVVLKDQEVVLVSISEAGASHFEISPDTLVGLSIRNLGIPDEHIQKWVQACQESFRTKGSVNFQYADDSSRWLEIELNSLGLEGNTCQFSFFINDLSEQKHYEQALREAHELLEVHVQRRTDTLELERIALEKANEQLRTDAFRDALTGLSNRLLFTNRLAHAIERYKRNSGHVFTVLYMDIDHFKFVNDTLSHAAGDALLIGVGQCIKMCVREEDTVARLGGDEFAILLEQCDSLLAQEVVQRLRQAFKTPFEVQGYQFALTASIGLVTSKVGHKRPEDVLHEADLAMYQEKASRSGKQAVFVPSGLPGLVNKPGFEAEFRTALEDEKLELYFQPIVRLVDASLKGFEVLVRWPHPEYGILLPDAFIPLAEEMGLIGKVDRMMLSQACRQLKTWRTTLPRSVKLSLNVNISSQQFLRPDLTEYVLNLLNECELKPKDLILEITESLLMHPVEQVDSMAQQLVASGVELSIDDFGTGYASLKYLQRFPAKTLKIERGFVRDMDTNNVSAQLVQMIITMAKTLGLQVVAEGIETKDQWVQLNSLGCDYGQGYLFAKPLNPKQATAFLTSARQS